MWGLHLKRESKARYGLYAGVVASQAERICSLASGKTHQPLALAGSFYSPAKNLRPNTVVYADQTGFANYFWHFEDACAWPLEKLIEHIQNDEPESPVAVLRVPKTNHYYRGPSNVAWLRNCGVHVSHRFEVRYVHALERKAASDPAITQRLQNAWETNVLV